MSFYSSVPERRWDGIYMNAKLHIHRLQPSRLQCPAQGKISNIHESASAHGTSRAAHSRRSKERRPKPHGYENVTVVRITGLVTRNGRRSYHQRNLIVIRNEMELHKEGKCIF